MTLLKQTALLAAGLLASVATWAVGTPAGTSISNTATATYDIPGGTTNMTKSSTVSLTVLELINVNVTSQNSSSVSTSAGSTQQVLTYVVTNTGNGIEDFVLGVEQLNTDDYNTLNTKIYRDTNGNGVFDSGDTLLTAGSSSIGLDANSTTGNHATIFIVSDIPNTGSEAAGDVGQLKLIATSETVETLGTSVTPGQTIAGAGSGGAPDAVVGNNFSSDATGTLEIGSGSGSATVTINKTITKVVDPFGGNTYVPGSIVSYSIAVTIVNGDVNNLVIRDPIPATMDYVANTLKLDSSALTDSSADADVGSFNSALGSSGTAVVNLGNRTVGSSFIIEVQAEIK
jgi:hypothetical protein